MTFALGWEGYLGAKEALITLTCLKSVPRSDTRKERFRRSLRVPRKERQSRSCHGMGKFIFFIFFPSQGYFWMVGSAHVRKLWVYH